MHRLNSAYARYFNKKYKRRGFLFQDRYKSIVTQDTNYFKELIRYIHLNPIRAGRVKSLKNLGRYKWIFSKMLAYELVQKENNLSGLP